MFKELFHKAYPEGSQEAKIRLFCKETGYGRSVVYEWLAGTESPREVVVKYLQSKMPAQK